MKCIGIIFLVFIASIGYAANIRLLQDDAFEDEDKAAEAAKIINSNFQELINSKVDASTPALSEPSYFVSDLLDPEQEDYNVMAIMSNSDDLWAGKVDLDGIQGFRSDDLVDILDPDSMEETIGQINNIFIDLDSQKVEIQ